MAYDFPPEAMRACIKRCLDEEIKESTMSKDSDDEHVCEWFKSGSCVVCGGPYVPEANDRPAAFRVFHREPPEVPDRLRDVAMLLDPDVIADAARNVPAHEIDPEVTVRLVAVELLKAAAARSPDGAFVRAFDREMRAWAAQEDAYWKRDADEHAHWKKNR